MVTATQLTGTVNTNAANGRVPLRGGPPGRRDAERSGQGAAAEAVRRGARLRVLSIVNAPEYWSVPLGMIPLVIPVSPAELRSAAVEVAQQAVEALSVSQPELVAQIEID